MPKITKAVIAAGGWSTRFLPTVKAYAKHLIPVLDKPQIHHLINELIYCGITEICIVHRPRETTIKQYLESDQCLDNYLQKSGKTSCLEEFDLIRKKIKHLKFIPQTSRFPYGNGTPILCAQSFIAKDPFVYMFGDDLVIENTPGKFLLSLINTFTNQKADAVVGCQNVPKNEVNAYGIIKFANNRTIKNKIESIIEKPPVNQSPSTMAVFGRFVFSSKIIPTLKSTSLSRNELWVTDAVNRLCPQNTIIGQPTLNAQWITTGDPTNWLKANIILALRDPVVRPQILKLIKENK